MTRAALALVAVLAGCSLGARSDPSRYFTLSAVDGDAATAGGGTRPLVVGIGPVVLPAYLERSQIATRVGPNEVRYAEFDRWAEPLDAGIARALQQELAARVAGARVVIPPWPIATTLDRRIAIEVRRFEATGDGQVELDARWAVRDGRDAAVRVSRDVHLTQAVTGDGTPAAVAAMSQVLDALGREIAADVR